MEPTTALGQGARVIVGLKKDWEAASKDDVAKELGAREDELHQKIKDEVSKEKDVEKRIADAKAGSLANKEGLIADLNREKDGISKAKDLYLREKEMVLNQRRSRRWFSSAAPLRR